MNERCELSLVVIACNRERETWRTLHSLSAEYQRYIATDAFEIIVVDNGSRIAVDTALLASFPGNFRLLRIDDAPASPAYAINCGLRAARGEIVGVMFDGARIATPGLLQFALRGAGLYENAIVATRDGYLGDERACEDALHEIAWPSDGYRLFEMGTSDAASVDGWSAPVSESNAVFARREIWEMLDGVDERFDVPGGGLLKADTLERLLAVDGARLVMLLAEATFDQSSGGSSSHATPDRRLENRSLWADQYAAIHGRDWSEPDGHDATFVGTLPTQRLRELARAATTPLECRDRTSDTSWFGYPIQRSPLDLWMYQELVARARPEAIVETGTFRGGSALYLAMLLDGLGQGEVITIDIEPHDDLPKHPRITYVTGSSTDADLANWVVSMVGDRRAMVFLDSDQSVTHVYDELNAYAKLLRAGDYFVVRNTESPEAIERFLSERNDFVVDRNCEQSSQATSKSVYLRRG